MMPAEQSQSVVKTVPETGLYTGEVVYIYAYDVAYDMTGQPVRELLGQPVAQFDNLGIEAIARVLMGVERPEVGSRYEHMVAAAEDYLLTLELFNLHTGENDKESAKIRKGYHKTMLGKQKEFGWR